MSDYIRLEKAATELEKLAFYQMWVDPAACFVPLAYLNWLDDCIRLAVSKAEKVEGFVSERSIHNKIPTFAESPTNFDRGAGLRHALLLLGPKYEPKPVKSAEERIEEALAAFLDNPHGAYQMVRILRGEHD